MELPKDELFFHIVWALRHCPQPERYGYGIAKDWRLRFGVDVDGHDIYPILRKLRKNGHATSTLCPADDAGPPKVVFSLTDEGIKLYEKTCEQMRHKVERIKSALDVLPNEAREADNA